ncbi:hypothetical protein O9992_26045 [Vibrio lentus]|nr:hypothetical protein [Vibrio lentus]
MVQEAVDVVTQGARFDGDSSDRSSACWMALPRLERSEIGNRTGRYAIAKSTCLTASVLDGHRVTLGGMNVLT